MGSRFYPLLYLLTRVNGSRDLVSGVELKASLLGKQSRLEVHHVFPKAQLYKEGMSKGEVNAIANFCFLTAESNKVVTDRLPEEYFRAMEAENPGVLASQWIPADPRLWKLGAYRDFLEERRRLLASAANAFLSSLHELPPEVAAPAAARAPEVPGGFEPGGDQEVKIEQAREWMREQGLPEGLVLYELADGTGTPVAILDVAWPEGVQPGLTEPVTLLLEEAPEVLAVASAAGYRCLRSFSQLKKYVRTIAREEAA